MSPRTMALVLSLEEFFEVLRWHQDKFPSFLYVPKRERRAGFFWMRA